MKFPELGEYALVRGGSVNPAKFPDEVFELHSIPSFDRGHPDLLTGSEIGSSKQIVQPGDVMISKIVPHVRRAHIVPPKGKLRQIASGEWIVFRTEDVDPSYFRHFLLSDGFNEQFLNTVAGVGGSLVRARPEFVKRIRIPLPELEEQRRIAAILDKADEIRSKRQQMLDHLDTLTQSIFHDMFGDPATWAERWPMETIGDLAVDVQYGTSEKSGTDGEWPILRMGNITDEGRLELADLKYADLSSDGVDKYTVVRGDLLFNRTNSKEKVGKSAAVRTDRKLGFAGYLVRVRFGDEMVSEFVASYLNSVRGRSLRLKLAKAAVNQANISASEMKKILVAVPPITLQKEFVARIDAIEARREQLVRVMEQEAGLSEALQAKAFRGEL